MTEHRTRKGFSLRIQFLIVLLLSVALGFLGGAGLRLVGDELVERVYLSPQSAAKRSQELMDSFEEIVAQEQLSAGHSDRIARWVRQHRYLHLAILSDQEVLVSIGWKWGRMPGGAAGSPEDEGLPSADSGDGLLPESIAQRTITFSNGSYSVWIYDYSAEFLRRMVRWSGYLFGAVIVLLVPLLHHRRVILRIIRLSRQVEDVAQGNVMGSIDVPSGDEIGDLSRHVSAMRDTIMAKMQAEQQAWNANSALITRMSHDIRTPLTVLIGFLELMEEGEFSDDESYRNYLSTCLNNAAQLKEQADTLFQYFLVYGHGNYVLNPEVVDARTLVSQLIGEHVILMGEKGWQIITEPLDQSVPVRVDTMGIKRLIDNLFSNVEKYADPRGPVILMGRHEGEQIHILMRNIIREGPAQADSSGIGLKTCERIAELLGGSFRTLTRGHTFQADIFLPVWQGEDSSAH